jgi:hypothetical protein
VPYLEGKRIRKEYEAKRRATIDRAVNDFQQSIGKWVAIKIDFIRYPKNTLEFQKKRPQFTWEWLTQCQESEWIALTEALRTEIPHDLYEVVMARAMELLELQTDEQLIEEGMRRKARDEANREAQQEFLTNLKIEEAKKAAREALRDDTWSEYRDYLERNPGCILDRPELDMRQKRIFTFPPRIVLYCPSCDMERTFAGVVFKDASSENAFLGHCRICRERVAGLIDLDSSLRF